MDQAHICIHDHAHLPRDIVAEAERYCRDEGLRLTDQRRRVLEMLAHSPRPLGAYELLERSVANPGKPSPKRLAPIAIYRALDFLMEAGLIHRLESRNAFFVCPHRHASGEAILFLICEHCGTVEETTSPALEEGIADLAQARGFAAQAQVLELIGRCRACTSASPTLAETPRAG